LHRSIDRDTVEMSEMSMASKNSVKVNLPQAYYHIYNRGVEKRSIFLDDQDYSVFLSNLKTYLCPKDENFLLSILSSQKATREEKIEAQKLLNLKNYSDSIDLLAHALMPNHFHLLIYQSKNILDAFMNSLGTRYVMYFNKKYDRKGVLFQDVYKAVRIQSDDQLLYISKYIHLNGPTSLNLPPHRYKESKFPCSLREYIEEKQTSWIKTNHILNYFNSKNPSSSYRSFILDESKIDDIQDELIDFEE
jgi:putative transposase